MKNRGLASCIYAVIFATYSLVLFLLPVSKTAGFWAGYLCTCVSLALCLMAIWKDWFAAQMAHLGLSLGTVATIFFVAQLFVGGGALFLPLRWTAVFEISVLGSSLVCILGTWLGGRLIKDRETEFQRRGQFMRELTVQMDLLTWQPGESAAQKKLDDLREAIRFSDPMSTPGLEPIERRMAEQAARLAQLVTAQDWETAKALCDTLTRLLTERNRKCREMK